jgi:hypothetical protein
MWSGQRREFIKGRLDGDEKSLDKRTRMRIYQGRNG